MAQLPFSFTSSQLKWFKNVTFLKVKAKMWKNLRGGSYLNTLTISSSFFSLEININFIGELTECIKTDKEFFHHNSMITCKAIFQRMSNCFITVISPGHWLLSNKKKHARELSSIPKELCWQLFFNIWGVTSVQTYEKKRYSLLLR